MAQTGQKHGRRRRSNGQFGKKYAKGPSMGSKK